jgi:uncharacterized protein (DUF433 family)
MVCRFDADFANFTNAETGLCNGSALSLGKYFLTRTFNTWHAPRMMLNWDNCRAVSRSPDVMSGALVFKHSRLPVDTLFGNLEAGATIDEFLDWHRGVPREQVEDVIRFVRESAQPNENSF